jgi:hypothetical protein
MAKDIKIGNSGTELIAQKCILNDLFDGKPKGIEKICRQRGWIECMAFVKKQADYLVEISGTLDDRKIVKNSVGEYSLE